MTVWAIINWVYAAVLLYQYCKLRSDQNIERRENQPKRKNDRRKRNQPEFDEEEYLLHRHKWMLERDRANTSLLLPPISKHPSFFDSSLNIEAWVGFGIVLVFIY